MISISNCIISYWCMQYLLVMCSVDIFAPCHNHVSITVALCVSLAKAADLGQEDCTLRVISLTNVLLFRKCRLQRQPHHAYNLGLG